MFHRVLDFKKVKQKEREAAKQLYKSKEGKTQLKDIQRKAKTFTPGEPLPEATNKNTNAAGLTPEQVGKRTFMATTDIWINVEPNFYIVQCVSLQVRQIKMMIAKAGSLEEIERLNMMLRNGQMPGMEENKNGGETEEMETDR